MATITITCPECEKKSQASDELVGKKIRCKGCDTVFVIKAPAKAPSAAVKAKQPDKKASTEAPKASTPPKISFDEDDDGKPYILTETNLGPRCPECANEMESENSVVCIHCGYNTRTRQRVFTKKVYETTAGEVFLWLLPGILCLLGLIGLLTFDILYSAHGAEWLGDEWYSFLANQAFIVWLWVISLFIFFFLGKFAIMRLIFNNSPPEIEKK